VGDLLWFVIDGYGVYLSNNAEEGDIMRDFLRIVAVYVIWTSAPVATVYAGILFIGYTTYNCEHLGCQILSVLILVLKVAIVAFLLGPVRTLHPACDGVRRDIRQAEELCKAFEVEPTHIGKLDAFKHLQKEGYIRIGMKLEGNLFKRVAWVPREVQGRLYAALPRGLLTVFADLRRGYLLSQMQD